MENDLVNSDPVAHPGRRSYVEDGVTWYDAAQGERIAVRVPSSQTDGRYAVVESIAEPGCGVPLHVHQNEDEYFTILAGTYRFVCGDQRFEASAGASFKAPRGIPHAWRNISTENGRLVVVLTPGGFECLAQEVINAPADKVLEIAAGYGCTIVGPPLEA